MVELENDSIRTRTTDNDGPRVRFQADKAEAATSSAPSCSVEEGARQENVPKTRPTLAGTVPKNDLKNAPSSNGFHPATKAPKQALEAVYKAGEYKAGLTLPLLCVQSTMAGIYISMASQLYLSVGGGLFGAAMFPTGLIAVVLTSGELFTGDALVFVASVLGKRVEFKSLIRNWTVSWFCNLWGCLAWAFFLGYLSDALEDKGQTALAISIASKKAHSDVVSIFFKGVGANFMVCVSIWQATCAEEVAGKVLALWFPVAGFVMMGFEHCIANQFFIPLGMMLGADISVGTAVKALMVATLGNIVGGGICVGAVYWYTFDSMVRSYSLRNLIHQVSFARRGSLLRSSLISSRTLQSSSVQHTHSSNDLEAQLPDQKDEGSANFSTIQ